GAQNGVSTAGGSNPRLSRGLRRGGRDFTTGRFPFRRRWEGKGRVGNPRPGSGARGWAGGRAGGPSGSAGPGRQALGRGGDGGAEGGGDGGEESGRAGPRGARCR